MGKFNTLVSKLRKKKHVTDPAGLAASIGRKKLGKSKFQALAQGKRARADQIKAMGPA